MAQQLRAFVVQRDAKLNILSEKVVGKFAIVTNEDAETTEVIRTRFIEIEALLWKKKEGILQLELALGGTSAAGVFYRNPKYDLALVSWRRDANPQLWATRGLDDIDPVTTDMMKGWLHQEDAVYRAGRDIWGIENLESQWQGAYLRQPQPPDPPPPAPTSTQPGLPPADLPPA
jgi:hypothetical protein